ncbi:MAG: ComF family protein [Planctomycetota bacterium]
MTSTLAWDMLLQGFCSLLAPERCLACGAPHEAEGAFPSELCGGCRERLGWIEAACLGCGRPRGPGLPDSRRCGACVRRALGGVRSTTALLRYRGPGRQLLRRLKYDGLDGLGLALGRALGERLLAARPGLLEQPGLCVVPVPLHPWRRLRRGFNQAEVIARGVAEVTGRPLRALLRRRRATRALYGVRRGEREAVVAEAFALARGAEVRGARVLLVDDIVTSGATLRAAARALRRGGVARLDAAVVAR